MTVQHSGGLHAARLLNMCVCVVCAYGKKLTWWISAGVWVTRVLVSGLSWWVLYYVFVLVDELGLYHWTDSAAHVERVHRGGPVTANESQVSYSRSTLAEGETLRGRGGGNREILSVHLFLCLSVRLYGQRRVSPPTEVLDWFASNDHSCTGNLAST